MKFKFNKVDKTTYTLTESVDEPKFELLFNSKNKIRFTDKIYKVEYLYKGDINKDRLVKVINKLGQLDQLLDTVNLSSRYLLDSENTIFNDSAPNKVSNYLGLLHIILNSKYKVIFDQIYKLYKTETYGEYYSNKDSSYYIYVDLNGICILNNDMRCLEFNSKSDIEIFFGWKDLLNILSGI